MTRSGEVATITGGSPLRLLQITDFHFRQKPGNTLLGVDTEQSFRDTLAAALAEGPPPDLALLTGDLVQDASPEAYRRLRNRLTPLSCPVYCLPGNHDDVAMMAQVLAQPPVFWQPRIRLDPWQILCLDSSVPDSPVGRLAAGQLDILAHWLTACPDHFTLIALHHPPIPTGSAWMDTMQLENSAEFLAALCGHDPVKGVVFGHIHQELDVQRDGLRLLGCPSTCFQFKPAQAELAIDPVPPGYRWIELHSDGRIGTTIGRLDKPPAGLSLQSGGY
jgi:Icc protein